MTGADLIIPQWPAPGNVHAAATTRRGGYSQPPYDSFNLAAHVGDQPEAVQQNRELLRRELRLPASPCWLDQRHGSEVAVVDNVTPGKTPRTADAAVAQSGGKVCVVLTADCLPVLLCDKGGTCVAAVHAGWRGLAAGVLAAALAQLNVPADGLMAWLGPCISARAYEVDQPVRARLLAASPDSGSAFHPSRPGHWLADLAAVARLQLREHGVIEIYGTDLCTYSEPQRFFSHRRDGDTGRQATLIWLQR